MTTWTSRILLLIFFVNCLQLQAWAGPRRASKKRQTLEQRVEQEVAVSTEQAYKEAKAELEAVLKESDLSSTERQYAELELQIINTEMEMWNAYDEGALTSIPLDKVTKKNKDKKGFVAQSPNAEQVARVYGTRIANLKAREDDLEMQEALRLFYQEATQDKSVAMAVFGLHNHAYKMATRNFQEDSQFRQDKSTISHAFAAESLYALPKDNTNVEFRPRMNVLPTSTLKPNVLKLWEDNKITLEDLVEYADPIVVSTEAQPVIKDIAGATMLLFSLFYAYNTQAAQLDEETLKNTAWLAQRLKYRAAHQLHVLQQKAQNADPIPFVEARGNLMLLIMQLNTFLSKYSGLLESKDDTQLPQYATAEAELKEYRQSVFSYTHVGNAISNEIKQALQSKPAANTAAFGLLAPNVAYAVRFAMFTGDMSSLIDFVSLINQDGKTMHGNNEQFVSTVFGSIFDTLINYSISENTQRRVKQLLICAAAPECTYGDKKMKNAVNVRTQALAVSSMLRQVAKNNKVTTDQGEEELKTVSLNKALFNDQAFRSAMASFAVDLYWPLVAWHGPTGGNDGRITNSYGLQLDEVKNLSNYLAVMFESFLPVPEPNMIFKTAPDETIHAGCFVRAQSTKRPMAPMQNLAATKAGSIRPSMSKYNEPCPSTDSYGSYDNAIVYDSNGRARGITTVNLYNQRLAVRNFATGVVTEVATWFMWGAAFKAVSYLWKAAKAAALASRVAMKAPQGLKAMRFQSKFSQAWKYSTKAFEKEAGIVNLTKQGEKITVELHRPGFQGYVIQLDKAALQGHSLKSLKGRVLLRRAMNRKVMAQYGKATKTATTGEGLLTNASKQVVRRETTNELAQEILRPLTKAEQQAVREEKAIVDVVKKEIAGRESFEIIPAQNELPFALYRPTSSQSLFKSVATDLSEKPVLNPLTGNVTGELSGKYMGTITSPFTQETAAYNIAAATAQSPSFSLAGRTVYNMFPKLQEIKGLTKFVLTLEAMDPIAYYLYTKPYMEKFAQQQDDYFTALSGLKKDPAAVNGPKTILDQIQSMQTALDTSTGATISGAFLGANQALNTFLPGSLQTLRKDLFQLTTNAMTTIDGPMTKQLEKVGLAETIPGVAQITLLPAMLASDPTPQPSEAAKVSYMTAAHQQQVADAMQKHSVSEFTDTMNNTLKELNKSQEEFLKSIETFKPAPQLNKEVKRTYRVYEQALKQAKLVAQNDFNKAQKSFEDAWTKWLNTRCDIVTRAITQLVQQEKPATLQSNISAFKEAFKTLFTEQDEKELKGMIAAYYKNYQAAATQLYTAEKQALKTGQKVEDIQQAANEELARINNVFVTQRQDLADRLNARADQQYASADGQSSGDVMFLLLSSYVQSLNLSYDLSLAKDAPEELRNSLDEVYNAFSQELITAYTHAQSVAEFQNTYSQLLVKRDQQWRAAKVELLNKNADYKKWLEGNENFSSSAAVEKSDSHS